MDTTTPRTNLEDKLRAENAELCARLEEAEQTLRAIRGGEVDALIVETADGPQVFTLQGLDAESSRFRGEILAQVSDAVIAVDAAQRVTYLNAAAERHYRVSASDALGRHLSDIFTRQWPSAEAEAAMWAALREKGEWHGELTHRAHDGRELQVEPCLTLLRDADGADAGMVAAIRDITERKRAEESLRESLHFIHSVLYNLFAFVGVMSVDGTLTDANRSSLEAAGIPASEVLGKKFWDCYWWSYSPEIQAQLRDACERAAGGELVRYDVPVRMAGDTRVWIDFQVSPLRDTKGRITHLIPSALEIEVRHAAEQALRESEERFRIMTDGLPLIIWVHDARGELQFVNQTYCEFFGVTPLQVAGPNWHPLVHPEDRAAYAAEFSACLRDRRPFHAEVRARRSDGEWRWLESHARPRFAASGEFLGMVGSSPDITERKRAQEALRESEARYRSLFENMLDGFAYCQMIFDEHGQPHDFVYLAVNDTFGRLTGLENVTGKKVTQVIPGIKELHPEVFETYGRVALTGNPEQFEIDFKPLGVRLLVSVYCPMKGYFVAVFDDITERVQADAEIRRNEELVRTIAENSTPAMVMMDDRGFVTYCNQVLLDMTGYNAEEIRSAPLHDLIHHHYPDGRPYPMKECPIDRALPEDASVRAHEDLFFRKDGTTFEALCAASPIFKDGKPVSTVIEVRDITEQNAASRELIRSLTDLRRTEETLRASHERFRVAVDAVSDIIWTTTAEGKMEGEQPGWAAFTGQRQEQYQGVGWSNAVHPDDAQPTVDAWNLAVAERRTFEFENRVRRHDGQWRVCSIRAVPVLDPDGRIREWIGVQTDITERKAAEQKLFQHREDLQRAVEERTAELAASTVALHTSERLAALGTLAAGLGHDIANITMPIRARLDMLARTVESEEGKADIEATLRGVEHLSNISAGMRLLSLDPQRADTSAPVADLAHWCSQTTALFRSAVPRHITVECSMPSGVGVPIPAHRLAQAIFNLVQNAGEAMSGQKAGRIGVSGEVVAQPGDPGVVLLCIRDDGPGMPPAVLARCFEPYFSTKGRAISTGMGLAMVKGIVEAVGGRVLAESAPGEGATFTLSIPVVPAAAQRTPSPSRGPTAAVSIRHPRTASLACLFLEQLDMPARRTPPDTIPEAGLWVVEAPDPAKVATYLQGHSQRRVVMLGANSSQGGAGGGEGGDARVRRLPAIPTPDDLRQALAVACRDARSPLGER